MGILALSYRDSILSQPHAIAMLCFLIQEYYYHLDLLIWHLRLHGCGYARQRACIVRKGRTARRKTCMALSTRGCIPVGVVIPVLVVSCLLDVFVIICKIDGSDKYGSMQASSWAENPWKCPSQLAWVKSRHKCQCTNVPYLEQSDHRIVRSSKDICW